MSKPNFSRHLEADARLVMLRELQDQTNGSLNETILQSVIEAFGHNRTRDWVRTQLRAMEDVGAVRITEAGSILIATITRAGTDHVQRRAVIEGIARPSVED